MVEKSNLIQKAAGALYQQRLKTLKKGQIHYKNEEISKGVKYYQQYLSILANYFNIKEDEIHPKYFNKEKELAEIMLLSHVYWDLAKAYDRSPKLKSEAIKSLDKFVIFTVGYKYQFVNARMLKTYIKKKWAHNPKLFKDTYKRIQVRSNSCFIATASFGDQHFITNELRGFKRLISNKILGFLFIDFYYQVISPFILKLKDNNNFTYNVINILFLRPIIFILFSFVYIGRRLFEKFTKISN